MPRKGTYAQDNGGQNTPRPHSGHTWGARVRSPPRFLRDTENPQSFWRAPDVQPLCPGRGLMPKEAYAQGGAYAQKAYAQRLMPRVELMPK